MCGISGALGNVNENIVDSIKLMSQSMIHRGPDDFGLWVNHFKQNEGIVLAHRRLAIIDLSTHAAQPMIDKKTGNVIVFNGEIYNYKTLKNQLIGKGIEFETDSDTEVLLLAYRYWGNNFIHKLRGMFAFVIWDAKKRITLMFRDRLGIKPLYYSVLETENKKTVLFASEIRALLKSGLIRKKISKRGLSSYLWNGFVCGPDTIVEDVSLLAAGSMLKFDHNGEMTESSEYWSLPVKQREKESNVNSVIESLEESIGLRLISDVPVGVFLSGGIDSSVMANLASKQSNTAINTFNLSFSEKKYDESHYAEKVAKSIGTNHQTILLTQQYFMDYFDAAVSSLDQPTFDAINTFFISNAVRNSGITVALAGTGGDEIFGGYKSFSDIPKALNWGNKLNIFPNHLLSFISKIIANIAYRKVGDVPPQIRWGKLKDIFLACNVGGIPSVYQVTYALFSEEFYNQLLSDNENLTLFGLSSNTNHSFHQRTDKLNTLEAISFLELSLFLGQRLLRDTDAASMAVSLEVRLPLLDHVFLEQVAQLPFEQRFLPLGHKQFLREIGLNGIDKSIFDRPKSGFVMPFDLWCRQALQDRVEKTLNNSDLCRSVGLNHVAVSKLYRAFQLNAPGIYWSRIWAIYILLWWCEQYGLSL